MLFVIKGGKRYDTEVSILTRPYGRMLLNILEDIGVLIRVSILTRPYGRMLCDMSFL